MLMIRFLLFVFWVTAALADWTAVERDVEIPWDLEGTPLQIKTDSILGSNDKITVRMYNKDSSNVRLFNDSASSWISSVVMTFSSPVQYKIERCIGDFTDLPVQPPVEVETIWTIAKTETALIITCNDVEVLNYLFADSSNSKCVSVVGGNVVNVISFTKHDTASTFYRAAKCPAFTVEGSSQGYWPDSLIGTTATIECTTNHILVGNATLTCQEDLSWSSDKPRCDEIARNEHYLSNFQVAASVSHLHNHREITGVKTPNNGS
eukprot:sb/3468356/